MSSPPEAGALARPSKDGEQYAVSRIALAHERKLHPSYNPPLLAVL